MKPILFFALKADLLAVLATVESSKSLKYTKMGISAKRDLQWLVSGGAIPNLGVADADSSIACETYLVTELPIAVEIRHIRQSDGTVKFSVDQLMNPDTVTLSAGGERAGDVILHGRIASASDSIKSQEMMKSFSSAFRKHFRKVKSYWVGPNAYARLEGGARLTAAVASPLEYDLVA